MAELTRESIIERYLHSAERGRPYTWFNYQPINLPGYEETLPTAGRNCFDRCERMAADLESRFGSRPLKIIDWGSNLGFFCFELAKRGHEVVGVDSNRDLVSVCRYLARTNSFAVQPRFYCDELSADVLSNYRGFDVAICFSVFHHLGKELPAVLHEFSTVYPAAYVEMDGTNSGFNRLFSYYWEVEPVAEANDRYGSGRKARTTWFCSNRSEESRFCNIKRKNIVGSRGVFRVDREGRTTVVKRELKGARTHTWIDTDLAHEREMYRRVAGSRFFPRLITFGDDETSCWIELEYVDDHGGAVEGELRDFYQYLQDNRLFILDFSRDSFLFTAGRLKVIDLESLFFIESTLDELIRRRTGKTSLPFESYEGQLEHLLSRFGL